jgi:hypothetical protein
MVLVLKLKKILQKTILLLKGVKNYLYINKKTY